MAETQTRGRGRRGRIWHDAPGASLLASVILRSSLPTARIPTLSLAAGVAVAEAIIASSGVPARLKWPNDVLVAGRKIAGILLERTGDVVIIGVGVNVSQREFPGELASRATSIALEGGLCDPETLLAAVLETVARWRDRLERDGFEPLRARWMELSAMVGQRVSVDGVVGTALGLDDEGALLIETGTGSARVFAGDVEPAAG